MDEAYVETSDSPALIDPPMTVAFVRLDPNVGIASDTEFVARPVGATLV